MDRLLEKYLKEDRTDPKEVDELYDELQDRTRLNFRGDPVPFRQSNIVKFSRMSSRLPSDAMAFEVSDEIAVIVSGNHTYVIADNDDDIAGPFAIYDFEKMAHAILKFDRDKK